jgi:hypothetical protein
VVVPTADLTEVRVARGTRRHVLQGIAIGVLLGGIFGAATYHESSGLSCDPASFCSNWGSPWGGLDSRGFLIVGDAVGGGLFGAAIGAIVKTDRWELVNREDLQLTIRPRGAGLGIGVSLRF